MPLARKKKASSNSIEIPMSSMIDVVFLLLIYFIVTYQEEIPEAHLAVNLPSPSAPPVEDVEPPDLITLEVHPGEYMLRGKTYTLATIQKTLQSLAAGDPNYTVMIRVNPQAETKGLITILDICQNVGLTNLNVVTL